MFSKEPQAGSITAYLDDPRRIDAARMGEPAALEWLFQTYHPAIYSLCYRLVSRAEDAEDACQATFVSAFRGLPQFRGDASFKTWLYRIAANESMSILRKRRSRAEAAEIDDAPFDQAPDVLQRAAVTAILNRLPPDKRTILVLFYWESLSCEEIAAVLAISVSAAKMRLKRAREEFEKQYGGEA